VKFQLAPLSSNTVQRPRITRALSTATANFTLVTAGPGYGKTVAVRQWLSTETAPVAWVSLDPGDDSPARFWSSLAESLRRATGTIGDEALQMLAAEQDTGQVSVALLADLPRTAPGLIVVLDDAHVLRSPPLLAELGLFVERLPPQVRVVATSRVDPQLPLGRWRAAERMVEIRQRELRFTSDETSQLFAASDLAEIDSDDVDFLTDRTEGWAAGLQLAVLSLRHRSDAHDYIHSSLAGDRGLVDYLVGEVLDSLDDQDRDLILDLSILDDFDADLAVAVTGQPDAGVRIRSLESRNLFLLPADDRGERFRFHQLVRDLLAAELRWRDPGRSTGLHAAAAQHLELTGDPRRAAGHLLASGDVSRAYQLVVAPAFDLLDKGEVVAARQWLDLLPEGVLGEDADQILSHLVLLVAAGRCAEADRRAARLEADGTASTFTWLQQVQFAGIRTMLEYIRGDLLASKLWLLRCLELLGPLELRGPVLDRVGAMLVRHAIDDRHLDAATWWLAAMADHENESLVVREVLPTALRARLAFESDRLHDAERLSRHVVAVADEEQIGAVSPVGEARVVLAQVLLEHGRLSEADEQATIAAEELGRRRLTLGEVRARLVAVEVAAARFGPKSGRDLLEATRRVFEHRHLGTDLRQWLDAAECRLCLLDGDAVRARALLHALPTSNGQRLLAARAALQAGEVETVDEVLDGLESPSTRERVEALLLRARAASTATAIDQVREAAVLTIRGELLHTFLREGPDVVRLARRSAAGNPAPELRQLLEQVAPARGPVAPTAFIEPLASREIALLQLLPTHLTYGEIADQMCVSVNTVKTYQKALFRKLNASKRSDVVATARQAGLLDAPA